MTIREKLRLCLHAGVFFGIITLLAFCAFAGTATGYYALHFGSQLEKMETSQIALPTFSATKAGFPDHKNKLVSYAYDKGGKDFVLTLSAENGTFDKNRQSPANSNGTRDHGLCQLNDQYHLPFIQSKEFQDSYIQIDYCWEVYEKAINSGRIKTTFYGYNVRRRGEHLFTFN